MGSSDASPNIRMEPARSTVLCEQVAMARGSFGNVGQQLGDE